jgi:hypothetical protein
MADKGKWQIEGWGAAQGQISAANLQWKASPRAGDNR